jgi:hypothetical protein
MASPTGIVETIERLTMKNTVFGSTIVDAIALVIVFAGLGVLLAGGF